MPKPLLIHGTCVAVKGCGLLILGESGSGKSSLAAEMLLHGARLVADDQVIVRRESGGVVVASAPPALEGIIELYGLGVIAVPDPLAQIRIDLAVTLVSEIPERVPALNASLSMLDCLLPHRFITMGDRYAAAKLLLFTEAWAAHRVVERLPVASPSVCA